MCAPRVRAYLCARVRACVRACTLVACGRSRHRTGGGGELGNLALVAREEQGKTVSRGEGGGGEWGREGGGRRGRGRGSFSEDGRLRCWRHPPGAPTRPRRAPRRPPGPRRRPPPCNAAARRPRPPHLRFRRDGRSARSLARVGRGARAVSPVHDYCTWALNRAFVKVRLASHVDYTEASLTQFGILL